MRKSYVFGAIVCMVILVAVGGAYLYLQQERTGEVSPGDICNACGSVQIEQGIETASGYLDENYPQRRYELIAESAEMYYCGPCGGTSPVVFKVRRNGTVSFIITDGDSVQRFIQNLSVASKNHRERLIEIYNLNRTKHST